MGTERGRGTRGTREEPTPTCSYYATHLHNLPYDIPLSQSLPLYALKSMVSTLFTSQNTWETQESPLPVLRGLLQGTGGWEALPRDLASPTHAWHSLMTNSCSFSYPLFSPLGGVGHQDGGLQFSGGDDRTTGPQGEDGVPAAEGWLRKES